MKTANHQYNYSRLFLAAALLWALFFLVRAVAAANQPQAAVFAPGVISLPERVEFCLAMSPDEQEIFFTVRKATGQWEIHQSRRLNGIWQAAAIAPFSGTFSDREPSLSPDGKRLFFSSNRPRQAGATAVDFNIWLVERLDGRWSDPRPLPPQINGPGDQWRASQSGSGSLYYSSQGLWRCAFNGSAVSEPVKLFDPESPGALVGGHVFVAADESYLLTAWMNGPGGRGGWDLYVSFRDRQGNWGPSINLGDEVNTAASEDFPMLSPGGRDFYFSRYQKNGSDESGDIYRIDARFLDALKDKAGSN